MAQEELNILIKMRSDLNNTIKKVTGELDGMDKTAKKANASLVKSFQDGERSMISVIRTVSRVGFIFSATFGAVAASVINAGEKIKELDQLSISTGKSFDQLSREVYGFNVATEKGREGARAMQVALQGLQGWAIKAGSAIGEGMMRYASWFGAAQNGFKVSPDQVREEMEKKNKESSTIPEENKLATLQDATARASMSKYEYGQRKISQDVLQAQKDNIPADKIEEYRRASEQALAEQRFGFMKTSDFMDSKFSETIGNMKGTMSSFVYDAFTGNLKSASDYFKAFGESLLKTFSDVIAEMIVKWVIFSAITGGTGGGFASLFHSGGAVGSVGSLGASTGKLTGGRTINVGVGNKYTGISADTPEIFNKLRKHSGGFIKAHNGLAIDEVPIIAQTGEGVLSRRGMRALDKLNSGDSNVGGGGNTTVQYFITAVDAESFIGLCAKYPQGIHNAVQQGKRFYNPAYR